MSFQSLLPKNATNLEVNIEEVASRIEEFPAEVILDVWNTEKCPLEIVTWLGWMLSVEIWRLDWPEAIKRKMLRKSIELHLKKGTIRAIELILSCLDIYNYELVEWWETEPKGVPYSFFLSISLEAQSDPELFVSTSYKFLKQAIDAVKPVRASYVVGLNALFMGSPIDINVVSIQCNTLRYSFNDNASKKVLMQHSAAIISNICEVNRFSGNVDFANNILSKNVTIGISSINTACQIFRFDMNV